MEGPGEIEEEVHNPSLDSATPKQQADYTKFVCSVVLNRDECRDDKQASSPHCEEAQNEQKKPLTDTPSDDEDHTGESSPSDSESDYEAGSKSRAKPSPVVKSQ